MIYIDSNQGRIGPFWWVNGIHSKIEMYNATYEGSVHYVWRPGVFGLDQILPVKIFHAPFFCYRLISQQDNAKELRAARRPKPPNLKNQALQALESLQQRTTDPNIVEPIRRALEQLDG